MSQTTNPPPTFPADRALAAAWQDAACRYKDLTRYRISITLESDGWHIDYDLKRAGCNGGGPHYVIDAQTGEILSRRYEQ